MCIAGLFIALTLRPPPIDYSQERYLPERAILAPGETLYYTPTLTIAHGGYIKFVRTWWNADTQQVALDCTGAAIPSIVGERSLPVLVAGVVRGNVVKLAVPALPPGHYQLVSTAIGPTGGSASYYVPFEVMRPCG